MTSKPRSWSAPAGDRTKKTKISGPLPGQPGMTTYKITSTPYNVQLFVVKKWAIIDEYEAVSKDFFKRTFPNHPAPVKSLINIVYD